jgi:hypothetical protein
VLGEQVEAVSMTRVWAAVYEAEPRRLALTPPARMAARD